MNLVKAFCFAGFVLAGVVVFWSEKHSRSDCDRKAYVNTFLLYCLALSFGVGITQRESWPFSPWAMMAGIAGPNVPQNPAPLRVVGVDALGVEHDIDYRAWQPLVEEELYAWLQQKLPLMDQQAQDNVLKYLLEKANASRSRALAGEPVGTFDRFLGPFTAPSHFLHPKIWSQTEAVPSQAFILLRIYKEFWNLEERRRNPEKVRRVRVYEYPRQ